MFNLNHLFSLYISKGDCLMQITANRIAEALVVINKHAKRKREFPDFYNLKNEILTKLIKLKFARKIGLDIYRYPQKGREQVFTVVEVGDYCFHTTPTESDIQNLYFLFLKHRNPKPTMKLKNAEVVILTFLNAKQPTKQKLQSNAYLKPRISHEMRGDSQWFHR